MVKPYQNEESKKAQIRSMFDNIAGHYDFLNRFLSAGIDIRWRKKSLNLLAPYKIDHLLDIATGTGDFAFMAKDLLAINKITGIDLSDAMLEIARKKNKISNVHFIQADSEELPFTENNFDAASVAFGVRNFEDLEKGLKEIYRVLKPGAPFLVLEFSKIEQFPLKQFFYLYSRYLLPFIGKLMSVDAKAYRYLHDSMQVFPAGKEFANKLESVGFNVLKINKLSFGICTGYLAEK